MLAWVTLIGGILFGLATPFLAMRGADVVEALLERRKR